ncbi:MAG: HNH endonuclease [Verrucomicrobiales bacterium]|nr:HNH endonuclease [Verrucomicrobiae bacterium]MCP5555695.1 HNH endonuclease [Akkermansiaceae bacterium]
MSDILNKNIVLVLNRNWQAINIVTPATAFSQMCVDTATGLDIQGEEVMIPTRWNDWLELPVRDEDNQVGTPRGQIRVPTVIVLARFDRVPVKRPRFSARSLWERDGGRCQYTGRILRPGEGNIDHILPRSRGGTTTWENCVLAAREVNSRKADRTPEEAGLRLVRQPKAPREVPVTMLLRNPHDIKDWKPFLG